VWARAVSQLCRMLFADCFAGSTHTPEEIAEGQFEEFDDDGSALESQPETVGDQGAVAGVAPGENEDANPAADGDVGAEPVYATEKQRKFIFAKAHEHGVDEPTLRQILAEFTGQESTAKIPRDRVDVIVEAIGLQQAAV
jgi:hypothetical protein